MVATTNYIWDDENRLAEADGSNTIQTIYTNEPEQYGNLISSRIGNSTSYHHFDAIGSTRQSTNAAGAVTDTLVYDAWGNVVNRVGTTGVFLLWVGALGYVYDTETGLLSVGERIYGPNIGRWTSTDPLRFIAGGNLFLYCSNRPEQLSDPSGRLQIRCIGDNFIVPAPKCGDTIALTWDFMLGKPVPCDGYFVQEVVRLCSIRDCNSPL